MKSDDFQFRYDIKMIRELLDFSQEELADVLHTTQITVNKWEQGLDIPSVKFLEQIYELAINNGIDINKIKLSFYEDDAKDRTLMFHGSKNGIFGDLDLNHANIKSDFGIGFYLGENLEQAATWVCDSDNGSVYCFYAKIDGLKIRRFDVDINWILAICINRGYLQDRIDSPIIKRMIEEIDSLDVIIAPIADNIMYLTIQEFADGFITDEQCAHALSANHLGMQYVFKSKRALNYLQKITRLYLCEKEKEKYKTIKTQRLLFTEPFIDRLHDYRSYLWLLLLNRRCILCLLWYRMLRRSGGFYC